MKMFVSDGSTLEAVPLADLPRSEQLLAPAPTAALIRQIEEHGFETAIRLTRMDDGSYFVRAGRRRIEALDVLAEREVEPYADPDFKVWAFVRNYTGPEDLVTGLADNGTAQPNHQFAYDAIVKLSGHMSDGQIAAATGMKVARVRKYLKLLRLRQELLDAFLADKIAYTTADKLASLNEERQALAVRKLEANGRLTGDDVQALRREATGASFEEFMQQEELFDTPQYWPLIVDPSTGTVTIVAPDGAHYTTDIDSFQGVLREMVTEE